MKHSYSGPCPWRKRFRPRRRKLQPLSDHAKGVLIDLRIHPKPRGEINPGVRDRLYREGLATEEMRKSPYAKHKGGDCLHVVLTPAGEERARAIWNE